MKETSFVYQVNEEVLEATCLAAMRTLVDSAEEVVEFKCGVAIEQEYVK